MIGTNIAVLLLLLTGSFLSNSFILCLAAFIYGSVYSVANVGFSLLEPLTDVRTPFPHPDPTVPQRLPGQAVVKVNAGIAENHHHILRPG